MVWLCSRMLPSPAFTVLRCLVSMVFESGKPPYCLPFSPTSSYAALKRLLSLGCPAYSRVHRSDWTWHSYSIRCFLFCNQINILVCDPTTSHPALAFKLLSYHYGLHLLVTHSCGFLYFWTVRRCWTLGNDCRAFMWFAVHLPLYVGMCAPNSNPRTSLPPQVKDVPPCIERLPQRSERPILSRY